MSILFEAYSGKTSNIKNAERELTLFVEEVRQTFDIANGNYDVFNDMEVMKNTHVLKAMEYLRKEFKFKNIELILYSDRSAGYTIPDPMMFFKSKGKEYEINVFVYMSILDIITYNLTGPEILAIILHEIGHNIDHNHVTKLRAILRTLLSLGLNIPIHNFARGLHAGIGHVLDLIYKTTGFRNIIVQANRLINEVDAILRIYGATQLPRFVKTTAASIINLNFLGYYGERKSDSVSTKYGYGPELISALRKLGEDSETERLSTKIVNSNPITGIVYDLWDTVIEVFLIFIAPHPANINRAKNSVAKLKKDLNDPKLPKSLKKEIKEQIDSLEEMIKEMESIEFRQGRYHVFRGIINRTLNVGSGSNRNLLDLLYPAEKYEE